MDFVVSKMLNGWLQNCVRVTESIPALSIAIVTDWVQNKRLTVRLSALRARYCDAPEHSY
jgi:hypothetical protein